MKILSFATFQIRPPSPSSFWDFNLLIFFPKCTVSRLKTERSISNLVRLSLLPAFLRWTVKKSLIAQTSETAVYSAILPCISVDWPYTFAHDRSTKIIQNAHFSKSHATAIKMIVTRKLAISLFLDPPFSIKWPSSLALVQKTHYRFPSCKRPLSFYAQHELTSNFIRSDRPL